MPMYFMMTKMLTIEEVSELIGQSENDDRTTKKWLRKNNVPITGWFGKPMVNKFTFEFQCQLILVEELKKTHPATWSDIYIVSTKDKMMVDAVFKVHPPIIRAKKQINSKSLRTFIK